VVFKEALERVRQSAETIEDNWLGRTVHIPLAEPVQFSGRQWRRVRLLHAISREYIEALSDYNPAGETLAAQFPSYRRTREQAHVPEASPLGWESEERDSRCVMRWGGIFRSELELE
jgi:hypothetical protein